MLFTLVVAILSFNNHSNDGVATVCPFCVLGGIWPVPFGPGVYVRSVPAHRCEGGVCLMHSIIDICFGRRVSSNYPLWPAASRVCRSGNKQRSADLAASDAFGKRVIETAFPNAIKAEIAYEIPEQLTVSAIPLRLLGESIKSCVPSGPIHRELDMTTMIRVEGVRASNPAY